MENINLRNLAYLGDAIWELHIRQKTILITNNAKKLHLTTTNLVKTHTQSELLHFLEPNLTQEEIEIIRRARNLPIPVGRRNIQTEYRQATAFETLIGWWHTYDKNRLEYILNIIEPELNNYK
ncbi:MAG: ribonuclease III [Cyanobacteria bacterium SIG26]|nr:ribonuclease III [Cyanobacteria bacterium SIG26]